MMLSSRSPRKVTRTIFPSVFRYLCAFDRPSNSAFLYASLGEPALIRCVLTWTTFRGSPSMTCSRTTSARYQQASFGMKPMSSSLSPNGQFHRPRERTRASGPVEREGRIARLQHESPPFHGTELSHPLTECIHSRG